MTLPEHAALYPPPVPSPGEGQKNQSPWRWLAMVLGWGMLGALIAVLESRDLLPSPYPRGGGMLFLLGLVLSFWPHVLLHEAGHALAGRLAGMRLLVAMIGPWRLQKEAGRWRVSRAATIAGLGGFAGMFPPPGREISRPGMAFFMLGGILANLATAAVLLVAVRALASPAALGLLQGDTWVSLFLAVAKLGLLQGAAWMALFLAVINLLPLTVQGWQSDGRQLWGLVRDEANTQRYLQLQRLSGLGMAGVRPRDWPAHLVPVPGEHAADSLSARLCEVLYAQWWLDGGTADALPVVDFWPRLAGQHARLPDGYRQYIALAMAEYAACHLRDARLLRAWREQCEGGLLNLEAERAVLDAELAALEGRHTELPERLAHAHTLLPRSSSPASRKVLEERLQVVSKAREG